MPPREVLYAKILDRRSIKRRTTPAALALFVLGPSHWFQTCRVATGRIAVLGHVVKLVTRLVSAHQQVPQNTMECPKNLVGSLRDEADVLTLFTHHWTACDPASIERSNLGGQPGQVGLFDFLCPPKVFHLVKPAEEQHLVSVLHATPSGVLEGAASVPPATEVFVLVIPVVVVRLASFPLNGGLLALPLPTPTERLYPAQNNLRDLPLHSTLIPGPSARRKRTGAVESRQCATTAASYLWISLHPAKWLGLGPLQTSD